MELVWPVRTDRAWPGYRWCQRESAVWPMSVVVVDVEAEGALEFADAAGRAGASAERLPQRTPSRLRCAGRLHPSRGRAAPRDRGSAGEAGSPRSPRRARRARPPGSQRARRDAGGARSVVEAHAERQLLDDRVGDVAREPGRATSCPSIFCRAHAVSVAIFFAKNARACALTPRASVPGHLVPGHARLIRPPAQPRCCPVTSPIAAGGLVLDIGGGLTLASAFMFKRPGESWREARTYLGSNTPLLVSAAKQTADGWVGAILLTAGFSCQPAVSAGAAPSWAHLWWTLPVALWLDAIWGLALWLVLRPFNVRRVLAYALEHLWPEYERDYSTRDEAVAHWWRVLDATARVAGYERWVGESLFAFGQRFLGPRRLQLIGVPPPAE